MKIPLLATALALAALILTGCGESGTAAQPEDDHQNDPEHEHAELAEPMSRMQYYSQKFGYAINAENAALADFYLHEMEELAETVQEEIPEYEGHAIGMLTEQLLTPTLRLQREALKAGDWEGTRQNYLRVIKTCNGCHAATNHGFIVITPAEGEPPFNQRFEPQSSDP